MASPLEITNATQDTTLTEWTPTSNQNTIGELNIRTGADVYLDFFSIIEFPLVWGTDIPAGVVITSATMSLYYWDKAANDPVGRTIDCQRLLRTDWVEAQATWNIYKTGSNWDTAGALNSTTDYSTTHKASQTVPSGYGWMTWTVTDLVKDFQTAGTSLHFRLSDSVRNNATAYRISLEDSESATNRPKMTINYTTGWANIASINGVASADIASINGVAVAGIAKINSVTV